MFAQQVRWKISQEKTDLMILNVPSLSPVKVNEKDLPTTEQFSYLVSTARHDGGAGNDLRQWSQQDQKHL